MLKRYKMPNGRTYQFEDGAVPAGAVEVKAKAETKAEPKAEPVVEEKAEKPKNKGFFPANKAKGSKKK